MDKCQFPIFHHTLAGVRDEIQEDEAMQVKELPGVLMAGTVRGRASLYFFSPHIYKRMVAIHSWREK